MGLRSGRRQCAGVALRPACKNQIATPHNTTMASAGTSHISTAPLVIDLHHVEKIYRGRVHALRGINMQVHRGEIFGLLGPNGAGKSTLVKIMMTVVRPTRADGTVLGQRVGHKRTLARVGYLPEHHRFPRYLTGRQTLDFYGALANVNAPTRRRRAEELLRTVGMTEWADKKVSSYSKGMMQRVGLAQALINDPDLVVLDEPTDGVDPVGRREIRDVLIRLREQGKTVFLNSHLLSELEMVCDRVAILVQGDVAMQGTVDELTRDSRRYEVVIEGDAPAWPQAHDYLRAEPIANTSQCKLVLRSSEPADVQPILDRLRHDHRTIVSVKPVRETLEDLFMRAVIDPQTGQPRLVGAAATRRPNGSGGKAPA
jgi:ABC-2 type transport system ATP-binding protein